MARILVDADGCPVVRLAAEIAGREQITCLLFCDTAHVFHLEWVETITVSKGKDSVDFALVNAVREGDIVVTQDYGLAAMCLARRAVPVSQDGMVYHNGNMDGLLWSRYEARQIRNAGGRWKGPSKRRPEQDRMFQERLQQLIRQGRENGRLS